MSHLSARRAISGMSAVAAVLLVCAACGESNHVSRLAFSASESPFRPGSKRVWSCVKQDSLDGPTAGAIGWAVGTPLVATAYVEFAEACGAFGVDCPSVSFAFSAVDTSTWTVSEGPEPGTTLGPTSRYLKAAGPGVGGLKATANGHASTLTVHALAPTSMRLMRLQGDELSGTLVPLSGAAVAPGQPIDVIPQLLDAEGNWLCGFPDLDVTASSPDIAIRGDVIEEPKRHANAPVRVTPSKEGTVHFSASGVAADLTIQSPE